MLTILIATDHKPLRETLSSIIHAVPLFRLIAVCADTHAAMAIAEIENPHIVLIDGSSDPLAVIEATKKIISRSGAGVIAISRHPDAGFAQYMTAAGALGYITHASLPAEIIMAIHEVAKDNIYLCSELLQQQPAAPLPAPATRRWFFPKEFITAARNQKRPVFRGIHWPVMLRFIH